MEPIVRTKPWQIPPAHPTLFLNPQKTLGPRQGLGGAGIPTCWPQLQRRCFRRLWGFWLGGSKAISRIG